MSNGTVYVVEWDTLSGFRLLRLLQSPQDYSSYGFSLCSMDINGDGLSDLLVGTPAYSDHSKSPSSYDEGRVYVYLHLQSVQENFLDNITLAGDRKMFARFGSAIGDIGDINRDLIHDVAVGAPEEDDGRGAVYIYLGSSKGPETTFSQRISGKDIDESLFSFGSHISRSTTATSPYNYPDFAVGSPESNAVVVLRTRLIVNAKANIITPASPINSSNDNCPAPARNPAFKASGCIMLQLCLSFSAEDPRGHYRNLSFDVSFEIDTLLSYDVVRRVRLLTNGQTETSVKETLTVNAGQVDCKTYDAILREDQIFRNPFIPVKMKATFALNVTSLQQPLKPVLNPSLPNETTTELRFINKCGEDQTCNADLVLEGRVTHEPVERDMNLNIVNITSEVKLDLTLVNKQETAYGVKITTQIQGRIRFRFATGEQGVSHVSCEAKDRDNTTVGSLVTCNSWSPLAQDEVLPVRLVFDAVSVPLEDTSRVISFEVRAMPSDPLQNPEVNDKDNVVTLNSTKVIVAEVHIDGSSDPKALYVIDSNVPELVAVQRLLVTNHGPSFLPPTYVNISLPYKDMEGRELLTSHNVSIKHQDGSEMQCTPTSVSDASLLTTTRTPPSTASTPATPLTSSPGTATTTQKPMPSGATRTTREPEEPTFGPVDPSRRRRREAGEEKQVETTDNSDQDKGSERSLQINCQTYRCKTFQCNLQTLHRNGQATIMVSLVLNKRVLEVSEKVDAIFYNTSSTVAEPSTPFFYKWSKLPSAKVSTIIYIKSSEGINLWIIIGGILGGIVLLIIIALILKKLGFFRRADKAKLERLKRQSGYYNKRRPPSSAPSPADQKT
ncbi:integrin alpha-IIb-like [Pomacea canaliculata]|uniref:integrin alpha-IIb-like n=1 Tax=Pomacea canaliculata TaxID=400727 RepID=UPI000D72EE33|nr:integrin alpha-IIb-like [Pomacea canaliculata]XP_025096223.1 integrin alpha-IIb-like [Pomacea canaliculata]